MTMQNEIDQAVQALPEDSREAFTGLFTSLREALEGDIQNLKGEHGEAIKSMTREYEVELAASKASGGSGGRGSDAGAGTGTLDEIRARHKREDDEAAAAKKTSEFDERVSAFDARELVTAKAAAKEAGVPDAVLALVDSAKELTLMQAIYSNGDPKTNAGTRTPGQAGSNIDNNLPPDKIGAGLKVLAANNVNWNS
jgi:hypothetical protein